MHGIFLHDDDDDHDNGENSIYTDGTNDNNINSENENEKRHGGRSRNNHPTRVDQRRQCLTPAGLKKVGSGPVIAGGRGGYCETSDRNHVKKDGKDEG